MLNKLTSENVAANMNRHEPKKLHLTKGQIFQGRIEKIFPNNLAVLRIGNINVSARLEAALTTGEVYWFEVTKATGIPRLKVLDDNLVRDEKPTENINGMRQLTPEQLLKQMGILANKTNEAMLRMFVGRNIPFTKDMLVQGGAILNELGLLNEKGINTLVTLVQRGLPITKEIFLSVHALENAHTPLMQDILDLFASLKQWQRPALQRYEGEFQSVLQAMTIQEEKHPLMQLFSILGENRTDELKQAAFSLIKKLGLMPNEMTEQSFYSYFKSAVADPKNALFVKSLWSNIVIENSDAKSLYNTLIAKLQIPAGKEGEVKLQQFLSLFNQPMTAKEAMQRLLPLYYEPSLSPAEKTVLQQMVLETVPNEKNVQGQTSSLAFQIAGIFVRLGMLHEKELRLRLEAKDNVQLSMNGEKIKSLLLQMLEENIPLSLKKRVETLVHRLTGYQLLASENHGPMQQIVMQIPLQLGQFPTDMTIQWEGKKKEDGKIDKNHCRILFYLHLERLKETIIDVQIQKRFVSIQIFNEHPRPNVFIDLLYPILKNNLAKLNYEVTSLNWKKNEQRTKIKQPHETIVYDEYKPYQGVDVRV